ncbi:hypothetical protein TWF730_003662 [Orbilia blumenaviensis]|uniref:Peptidase S8/S53 domain-containing protein n=1 Tax=Orbilia blumenaviensis TaxID=1796055 RepID=A0AAV9U303_9PEZI
MRRAHKDGLKAGNPLSKRDALKDDEDDQRSGLRVRSLRRRVDGNDNSVDEPDTELTASSIDFEETVYRDLLYISTPRNVNSLLNLNNHYWKYKKAGKGVTAYVIDSGADLSHPELISERIVDWLFTEPGAASERDDTDASARQAPDIVMGATGPYYPGHHGTSVTSKIIGKTVGVARDTDIVIVKNVSTSRARYDGWSMLDALLKVYNHVRDRSARNDITRSVIVMASGYYQDLRNTKFKEHRWDAGTGEPVMTNSFWDLHIAQLAKIVHLLFKEGVYIVSAAEPVYNSDGYDFDEGDYPNSLKILTAEELGGQIDLDNYIVVNPMDMKTGQDFHPPAEFTSIAAPGTVKVATDRHGRNGHLSYEKGSSLATPVVAGVLATFIGLGYEDPLQTLYENSYRRARGASKVVFNGITSDMWPDWFKKEVSLEEPVYIGLDSSRETKRRTS